MYLFVVYDSSKVIVSARLTDDLILNINNGTAHPDLTGSCMHFKVTEQSVELAAKIVNDPCWYKVDTTKMSTAADQAPKELKLGTTIQEAVTAASGITDSSDAYKRTQAAYPSRGQPYNRKIANYNDVVRPAILRAGATSLFANL